MKALTLKFLDKYQDVGLLLLRVGLGAAFIMHGWPKLVGGPDKWASYGSRLEPTVGIDFLPTFFGFMAAFAEFGGGILLILGLFMRPACLLLVCTMAVATLWKIHNGAAFGGSGGFAHPLELGIVFVGLFFVGPGKHSIDENLK